MGRRKQVDRPMEVKVYIKASVLEPLDQQLYSEIEGKVPYGARTLLINQLLREWLEGRGVVV